MRVLKIIKWKSILNQKPAMNTDLPDDISTVRWHIKVYETNNQRNYVVHVVSNESNALILNYVLQIQVQWLLFKVFILSFWKFDESFEIVSKEVTDDVTRPQQNTSQHNNSFLKYITCMWHMHMWFVLFDERCFKYIKRCRLYQQSCDVSWYDVELWSYFATDYIFIHH